MNLTWVEVSKSALLNNISQIRKNLSLKTKFIAVVKSNAYGHGLLQVVSQIKNKVDYLAVFDFDDAILLRQNKITKPILALGSAFARHINLAIKNNIELSVANLDILKAAQKISGNKKLVIHLCIDTGLGRDGFTFADFPKISKLLASKKIEVRALYTHFSAPDDSDFDAYTKKQIDELLRWKKALSEIGINPQIHASSTAGVFLSGFETHFDMVRVGGGIYGLWSSKEVAEKNQRRAKLIPALSWKAEIVELKDLKKGSHISYGCTFTLKRDSKIAILPVGYFDGIPRSASNKAAVLVNGVKASQLGRVTMNMIVIDVTDVKKIKVGDVVTIIGNDRKLSIAAEDWGNWSGSFNYEITTRINPKILRKVI